MSGFRMFMTIATMAGAYALIAVIQLPNQSTFDPPEWPAEAKAAPLATAGELGRR